MEPDFWRARWTEGRIGFHEGRPNDHLAANAARLGEKRRVLVPLCGKAEDLAFLASLGHDVVGVELVEDAVAAFFREHDTTPAVTEEGGLKRYTAHSITIFAGDFFATTPALLGPVNALYDRAAMIALPPVMRDRYVAHVRSLMPAGSPGLVVTLEYPEGAHQGPPFSVPVEVVHQGYAGLAIEQVGVNEEARVGMSAPGEGVRERAFLIRF